MQKRGGVVDFCCILSQIRLHASIQIIDKGKVLVILCGNLSQIDARVDLHMQSVKSKMICSRPKKGGGSYVVACHR